MELRDDVPPTYGLSEFTQRAREVGKLILLSRAFGHYFEFIDHERVFLERRDLAAGIVAIGKVLEGAAPGWIERPSAETIVTTTVDYFLGYLSNVLGDLYWSKPGLLPAKLANDLFTVEGEAWVSQVRLIVQNEVEDMSWFGFEQFLKRLREVLDAELDLAAELQKAATEAIEYRHVVVHHGCRVSSRFIAKTGKAELVPGTFYRITFDRAAAISDPLITVARTIDQALVDKFTLAPFWPRNEKVPGTQKTKEDVRKVIAQLETQS